jgi:adenylate kinase family enzyme
MGEFNSTFQPLLGFYRGRDTYRAVDGNRAPDQVFTTLSSTFKEHA